MPTRKQRRRRAKEFRHEYVWEDEEGNELDPGEAVMLSMIGSGFALCAWKTPLTSHPERICRATAFEASLRLRHSAPLHYAPIPLCRSNSPSGTGCAAGSRCRMELA